MDLSFLTEQQQWGIAYEVQVMNQQIALQNEQIDRQNQFVLHNQPLTPHINEETIEGFVTKKLAEIGNYGYSKLISFKEQQALNMFRALPPEQQQALIEQFQIPDVLQS